MIAVFDKGNVEYIKAGFTSSVTNRQGKRVDFIQLAQQLTPSSYKHCPSQLLVVCFLFLLLHFFRSSIN